jgi:hypothetical protein
MLAAPDEACEKAGKANNSRKRTARLGQVGNDPNQPGSGPPMGDRVII